MADVLRVGIAGCGRVTRTRHLPGFLYAPGCEVVALYNRTLSRAEAFLDQCSGARAFDDYEAFLQQGELDAVAVCTPNFQHAAMTLAALQAGKHVLVEKPIAMNLQEADRMIAAARDAGKVLMVHQNMRDHPAHLKAREMVEAGEVGRIYMVTALFAHKGAVYPEAPSSNWFLDAGSAGMGCMGDIGVHKADLIRFITGCEVESAAAFTLSSLPQSTVEDNAVMTLRLTNGAVASISTSWRAQQRVKQVTIFGEKATLSIDQYAEHALMVSRPTDSEPQPVPLPPYVGNDEQFLKSVVDFVRTVKGEIECPIDGTEGRRSLEVVLAGILSAREGRVVTLPLPADG